MADLWPIEDYDGLTMDPDAGFGDEYEFRLERAIAALKEIAKFRCTWATPDAEGCTCAGCIARRALRMEE